jgi:4-amino-4-deoxy-L-arabinose transferase-like glycosyltransferase
MLEVQEAARYQGSRGWLLPALVLLVGAFLLTCRLDDAYLWQDEAETALVSRHLLSYGLPLSSDGTDWVQQAGQAFVEFTPDYVWIYHSWLQYALTAAAFRIFGPTTFAARLPFVLVGLATLLFFHRFLRRWLGPAGLVAGVGSVLLLFCIPFVLLMRQDRYYALAAFSTLLTLDAYLHLRAGERWAAPYLILSAALLYHSHYGAFFPTMAALGVHWFLGRPSRTASRRFLFSAAMIACLVLPWASYMHVLTRGQPFAPDRFLGHLGQLSVYITGWVFPLVLVPVLLVACLRRGTGRSLALSSSQATFCSLAGLVVVINIIMLSANSAFDWAFFRYIAHLIPVLLAMLAIVVAWVLHRWPVAGYVLLGVLLASNGLHSLPYTLPGLRTLNPAGLWPASPAFEALSDVWAKAGRFRSDPLMYAQELTHEYEGPNEGLVAYFREHAQVGQTVLVNYEDLPLMFYTRLNVIGGMGAHGLTDTALPDWVVDRRNGPYRDALASIVASGSYERIELPYPDIRWENRPEPGTHNYVTVRDADPVVVYCRQGS